MKLLKLLILCSVVLGGGEIRVVLDDGECHHNSLCCKRKRNKSRPEQIQKELVSHDQALELCQEYKKENELLRESMNILIT